MKVLVIGASGGFGRAVAKELLARGAEVTALVRNGGRQPDLTGLWLAPGDVLDPVSLAAAARGAEVIVHGFNVPYPEWRKKLPLAADHVAEVAASQRATILFPGNVYGFGPDYSSPLAEDAETRAPNPLGELRNRVEERLRRATERGARLIILRAGDYFGPNGPSGWFEMMVGRARRGGPIVDPAPAEVPHAWAYLPDLAQVAVDLLERREELAAAETFHFAGHVVTSGQMIAAIRAGLGDPTRRVSRLPWWALRVIAPFWPMGRKVIAMRYLWQQPVLLDGSKLERQLGAWSGESRKSPAQTPSRLRQQGSATALESAVAMALGTRVAKALPGAAGQSESTAPIEIGVATPSQ